MTPFSSNLRTHHVHDTGKCLLFLVGLLLSGIVHAGLIETDWCSIKSPDSVVPGQAIEIAVTLKPSAAEVIKSQPLSVHLQWAKKEGYGGFLSWQPPRNVKIGETTIFRHTPKLDFNTMTGVMPVVFLAPNGDFEKRTKYKELPVIPIKVTPEIIAKMAEDARIAATRAAALAPPSSVTRKKSSLRILPSESSVAEGETFSMKVEYHLDPSDNWAEGTKIRLIPLGPWVDNPDGTYTHERNHHGYPGLGEKSVSVTPGEGVVEFTFKMGKPFRYNELAWMATFVGGDGKNWPWSIRGGGPSIKRTIETFDLRVDKPAGIFTYAETPALKVLWSQAGKIPAGTACKVDFKIFNTSGREVKAFSQNLVAGKEIDIPLTGITERGVMLVEATLDGVGTRDAFFARIPDLSQTIGKAATPFGCTNIGRPETAQVARKLGFSFCRQFTDWNSLEPRANVWTLNELDKVVDCNRAAGLLPWICLVSPPAWVLPEGLYGAGYEPFPFDETAWKNTASTLATHFKGRLWGFEWLNEILPGTKSTSPTEDYLKFCTIGTAEVKKVDPTMKIQLAGGLWPRNFRTDLLNASVAQSIDVLPVHYSNIGGVREAFGDLAAVGAQKAVTVWDNESAAGLSVWGMPARENLVRSVMQSQWVMRRWPAELVGGAQTIIYFGGEPQSAGNWAYLLDDQTPRPVAATLAVIADKLAKARPIGVAHLEPDTVLYLFEKEGKGLAVASTMSDTGPESALQMDISANQIVKTDHQGNETVIPTHQGKLMTPVGPMPVFLEGFDLAQLAAYAGLIIGQQDDTASPTLTIPRSESPAIPVRVRNPLAVKVSGTVKASLDSGAKTENVPFVLEPGASLTLNLPIQKDGILASSKGHATLTWTQPLKTSLDKPFQLVLIQPDQLGNLLVNGGCETPTKDGHVAQWNSGTATCTSLLPANGVAAPGLEGHAMRFKGNNQWQHAHQEVKLPAPGQTYLYSAWVWTTDMEAGSNLGFTKRDGSTSSAFIPAVFSAGTKTGFWRLLSHRRSTTDDLVSIAFQPVCRGAGESLYDNLRVTIFEGSDYAAEAHRAQKPIVIDGDLQDWDHSDPIPLLAENQVSTSGSYRWTPENISGEAWLRWDAAALYFSAWVRDDKQVVSNTGDACLDGDSLILALHPANRADGTDSRAFAWYLSGAKPNGGSGLYTLYRPAKYSGGLSSGQLAKDSSVYEIAIKRTGNFTCYEVRIPWSETGGVVPALGVKLGLSLQLNDRDDGTGMANLNWGGGLKPAWSPSGFGILTLVD